jgi:hypothetical protein
MSSSAKETTVSKCEVRVQQFVIETVLSVLDGSVTMHKIKFIFPF